MLCGLIGSRADVYHLRDQQGVHEAGQRLLREAEVVYGVLLARWNRRGARHGDVCVHVWRRWGEHDVREAVRQREGFRGEAQGVADGVDGLISLDGCQRRFCSEDGLWLMSGVEYVVCSVA